MTEPDLFDYVPPAPEPRFNGPDYQPERDNVRLGEQIKRIFELMQDGRWRSLAAIEEKTKDPPASISAQLRHLRKPRFGGHKVERRHVGSGLYEYRLIENESPCHAHQ